LALSGRGESAHQMYTRGSVIGEAWFYYSAILPTPLIIWSIRLKLCT